MLDDFMESIYFRSKSEEITAKKARPLIYPVLAVFSVAASLIDLYQTYTQGMSKYVACLVQLIAYGTLLFFYCKLLFCKGNNRFLLHKSEDERLTTAHVFIPTLFIFSLSMVCAEYTAIHRYFSHGRVRNFPLTALLLSILAIAALAIVILIYYAAIEGLDTIDISPNTVILLIILFFGASYFVTYIIDIIANGISLLSFFRYGGAICYCLGSFCFLRNFSFDPYDFDDEDEDEDEDEYDDGSNE